MIIVAKSYINLKDSHKVPTVKELNLSNNNIHYFTLLFELAKSCKIEYLDLSTNGLQDDHLKWLCEELPLSEQLYDLADLKTLKINGNKIGDQGAKQLIKLVVQYEHLNIECENMCFSNPLYVKELLKFPVKHLKFEDASNSISLQNKHHMCCFIITLGSLKDIPAHRSTIVSNIIEKHSLSLTCQSGDTVEASEYNKYGSLADAFYFLKGMDNLTALNFSGILIDERQVTP